MHVLCVCVMSLFVVRCCQHVEILGLKEVDYIVIEKGTGLWSAFMQAEVK